MIHQNTSRNVNVFDSIHEASLFIFKEILNNALMQSDNHSYFDKLKIFLYKLHNDRE